MDGPRFAKVEIVPPRNFMYSFHIRSPDDLDDEVRCWMSQAHRIGIQDPG